MMKPAFMVGFFHSTETVLVNPFTEARSHVWDGKLLRGLAKKQRYLCHALMNAAECGQISVDLFEQATDMIHSRLGDEYPSIESFLGAGLGISLALLTAENTQAYRLRWLDQLEQDWNQGDRQ